ncbi:Structural maintenance of chromosomes protein 1A [Sarcoptes scabiei]|nr:Structural maintenance of chromosomes protein 1A [Sarcoptes scabiei]
MYFIVKMRIFWWRKTKKKKKRFERNTKFMTSRKSVNQFRLYTVCLSLESKTLKYVTSIIMERSKKKVLGGNHLTLFSVSRIIAEKLTFKLNHLVNNTHSDNVDDY